MDEISSLKRDDTQGQGQYEGVSNDQQPVGWHATPVDFPGSSSLQGLLESQAERSPEAVALTFEGQHLSYRCLHDRAGRLARRLAGMGVGPESQVGVLIERSVEMVVALLAVIKAGGAYVPLDPDYPKSRLQWMVQDFSAGNSAAVVITRRAYREMLSVAGELRVVLADENGTAAEETAAEAGPPLRRVTPDNLAYVIYTSGSTGKPKGAMNTHRAIRNRLLWMQQAYRLGSDDCVLQKTPFSFDVSVWEFFWPLLTGARLAVAVPGGHRDGDYLVDVILQERVTTIHFVPSMLQIFLAEPGSEQATCLRRVIVSGEALTADLERRFFGRLPVELHNLYGPTEAAIDVTHWPCQPGSDRSSVPIGGPITGVVLRVLGPDLRPVEPGESGELHLGGVALARGYHRRAALTAATFIPDPYATQEGERLYKTGDLVRALAAGPIEFLGRLDHQIKLRGFRIELGEIEAVLGSHPAVREATLLLHEVAGDPRLVACAVPDEERALPVHRALEQVAGESDRELYELPNGLTVAHRNRAETDFLYREIFDEETYLRHGISLEDGDCVFDVGANIALFSLFVGSRVRDARIFAFEPVAPVWQAAQRNARLYDLDAEVLNVALADRTGRGELTYYPNVSLVSGRFADLAEEREAVMSVLHGDQTEADSTALASREVEEMVADRLRAETVECELRTLSEVMRDYGVERIDLLKVDVEKSELEVLAGIDAEDWPKIRQLVVEVHDLGGRVEVVREMLRGHGFHVAVEQDEALQQGRLFNLYAVRDPARSAVQRPAVAHPDAWTWCSGPRLTTDLRRLAEERLPEYMVPAHFVLLANMPLTSNGKVDRRALSELALAELSSEDTGAEWVAPKGPTEARLADLFAQLLGRDRVSTRDRFFELGGHSLLAAQLAARVRQDFAVELPAREIFDRPTVVELAARLDELREGGEVAGTQFPAPPPIRRGPRDRALPLAFQQQQIFFLDRLVPDSIAYNAQFTVSLHGVLSLTLLEAALAGIIRRHEALRTAFVEVDSQPVQQIHPPWEVQLPVVDLSRLEASSRLACAEALALRVVRRRFDVSRLPLIGWTLARLDAEDHLLIHVEHHFVHDGWSIGVFLHELMALYEAFAAGRPSPLPELPIQYADYALWQEQWMRGEVLAGRIDFWRRELAGCPMVLELPADRPRPPEQTFRGARLDANLPADLYADLRAASRRQGVTLFMTSLATFQVLLYRYTGQAAFVTGCGVANRPLRETEALIGMLVNTIVLRADLSGEPTFKELLARVRETVLRIQDVQDLPFDRLVEALQPTRDLSRNPIFQYMFSFHDSPLPDVDFAGLEGRLLERPNGSSKADFNVIFRPRAEQRVGRVTSDEDQLMRVLWEYSTDLFDATTVEWIWGHYKVLLRAVVEGPEAGIHELPLLTAGEQEQLRSWHAAVVELPAVTSVHELVERQADANPHALAADGRGGRLSYGELETRANRLAHHLMDLGVKPETVVGVCMTPTTELLVALLAVLKAGGAYLPLDPNHPHERLAYTLSDAGLTVVLTESRLLSELPTTEDVRWLAVDGDLGAAASARPQAQADRQNLAYVIYTSGSTGRPKGTELTHRGLLNLVAWHCRVYSVTPKDRAAKTASLAFDASVWEIWPYLTAGASLHFPSEAALGTPGQCLRWLAEAELDLAFLATPFAEAVLQEAMPESLPTRALLVGGDQLHSVPVELPFRLINHYGPTEGTVVSTYWDVAPGTGAVAPPIGRPIDNLRAEVIDAKLMPQPVGIPGELAVGGISLARGYLGRARLTAERFVPDVLSGNWGDRIYLTGDLVRRLPGGELDFVGRIDSQVKLRGFRIELGEIEAVLTEHPRVRQGTVALRNGANGEPFLAAYFVSADNAVTGDQLAVDLKEKLPHYMVPTTFTQLDGLPMSPNGKVDRSALPAPAMAPEPASYVAPRTAVEEFLADTWGEVLNRENIGVHDDFFDLGGHSLLAGRILGRLRDALEVEFATPGGVRISDARGPGWSCRRRSPG